MIECTVGTASREITSASGAHVLATGFYCQFYRLSSGCRSGVGFYMTELAVGGVSV